MREYSVRAYADTKNGHFVAGFKDHSVRLALSTWPSSQGRFTEVEEEVTSFRRNIPPITTRKTVEMDIKRIYMRN